MPVKPQQPLVLSGFGSKGLNTQIQDSTLGVEWFTDAVNIVYDYEGRIASRKGRKQISKTVASPVKSVGEFIKSDTTTEYFGGSGATIVELDTSTVPNSLTTQSFSGTPQTITDSNWQWVNFNNEFWGVQTGHMPINYDGTSWSDIDDLGTYAAPSGVTTFDPSCAIGDFGRMWFGGVSEDVGVVYYSDNLIGEALTGGVAGVIDLKTVWGNDEIVGLGSIMDKLVIFGKNNIAIYNGASDPDTMALEELIKGVGLAGRDNIVYVSSQLLFLSYTGLMSLSRVTESDGLAPIDTLSIAVRNELSRTLSIKDLNNIKTTYYQEEGLVITFIPDDDMAYVFDFANAMNITVPRITTFSFDSAPLCGVGTLDGKLYLGLEDSIGEYDGYYDVSISDVTGSYGSEALCETANNTWETSTCWSYTNTQYNYTVESPWLDLGNPTVTKIVKNGIFTVVGGKGSNVTTSVYKDYQLASPYKKTFTLTGTGTSFIYGGTTSLYGVATYAPVAGPKEYKVPLGRTGKVIKLAMTTEVKGNYSSLVNTTLLTKQGKIR